MSDCVNKDGVQGGRRRKSKTAQKEGKERGTPTDNRENLKAESLNTAEGVYPVCADRRLAASKPLLPFEPCVLSNGESIAGNRCLFQNVLFLPGAAWRREGTVIRRWSA